MDAKDFAEWGWRIPFWAVAHPAHLLGLHPAEAARVADIPADEGRGQGLEVAAHRQLPQVPEQQVRAARAARRHRRAGGGLVHGAVLRAVLPHHHAEARLRFGVHADRGVAADRHAVLHLLRLALGQDRPAEDHPGRLPDRRGHVLPAVRGPHALCEPGARGSSRRRRRSRSQANPRDCQFHIFVGPWSKFSDCDRVKDFLTKQGLSFKSVDGAGRGSRHHRSASRRSRAGTRRSSPRRSRRRAPRLRPTRQRSTGS